MQELFESLSSLFRQRTVVRHTSKFSNIHSPFLGIWRVTCRWLSRLSALLAVWRLLPSSFKLAETRRKSFSRHCTSSRKSRKRDPMSLCKRRQLSLAGFSS